MPALKAVIANKLEPRKRALAPPAEPAATLQTVVESETQVAEEEPVPPKRTPMVGCQEPIPVPIKVRLAAPVAGVFLGVTLVNTIRFQEKARESVDEAGVDLEAPTPLRVKSRPWANTVKTKERPRR